MRRAAAVKSIFWELRAAGIEGSARDLLRLAHFLLRSHTGELHHADEFGRVVDSRSLPLIPVDYAMAQGGWRILEFETARWSFVDVDVYDAQLTHRKLERIIGPLWAHSLPQD